MRPLLVMALVMGLVHAAATAPPRVVRASPDNGATGVDPATAEIHVVFDQPMSTGGFSFVGGGETYPKTRSKPTWVDDRTCILPVALEPEHEYWLSINSDRFTNFRSRAGEPAVPYPIAFKTGSAKAGARPSAPPTSPAMPAPPSRLTPEVNRAAIAQLKRVIDLDYSYRDLRHVDWERLLAQAAPRLEQTRMPADFAEAIGKVLAEAKDIHIWVEAGDKTFPSFRRQVTPNCNVAALPRLVPGWTVHNDVVSSGRVPDGIRYLLIAGWPADKAKEVETVFNAENAENAEPDFSFSRTESAVLCVLCVLCVER